MKLKGINPFEQHVEKLVFGLMLAFALAMLVLQFGGGSNRIEIDRKQVRPEQVMEVVRDKAQTLKVKLESDRVEPQIHAYQPAPMDDDFDDLGLGVSHDAVALGSQSTFVARSDTRLAPPPANASYAEVRPPAPILPVAAAFAGTVDPIVVHQRLAEDETLGEHFPPGQPYDKQAVSVSAHFDAAAFRELLLARPSEANKVRISEDWWRDDMVILAVEVEREELGPGGWGDTRVIPVLPGHIDLRQRFMSEDFMPRMIRTLVADARAAQADIRRPEYYPMISGSNWLWPEALMQLRAELEDDTGEARCARYLREWNYNNQQIAALGVQIERLSGNAPADAGGGKPERPGAGPGEAGDPGQNPPPGRDGRNPPGRDNRPSREGRTDASGLPAGSWPAIPDTWQAQMGGRGGGGRRDEGQQDDSQARAQREAQRKAAQIEALREKIARLIARNAELEQLLADECGIDPYGEPLEDPYAKVYVEELLPITSADCKDVMLWAHDITAKAGATYRYRMRVWVTNPFHAKAAALGDDQKQLAETPAISSDFSDWTFPVTTDAERYFFVVTAQQDDPAAAIRTRARATAELFEFHYGYWRRAVVRLDPGDPLIGEAEVPELPLFDLAQGDAGAWTATRREGTLPLARDIDLAGAFLLTVGPAPGVRDLVQAFLRDGRGDLVTRVPRHERESALYLRLSASAVDGLTAEVLEPGSGARREAKVPEVPERGTPGQRTPIGPPSDDGRRGPERDDGFTDPGQF